MLPEDWKLTTLGKVCEGHLQTGPFGSQLHAHEYQEIGVTVVMPKDIINCRVDASKAAKITIQRAEDLKKHQLLAGDLLFSRRGDVTRFALIDEKSEGSLCGTGCLKARPSKNHSPIFLSYILQRNMVKTWLEHNAVGQTMPNMNTAILAELPLISASSREEEDKIAQILSTWDKAIDKLEALIAAKQKRKKALMQQLLTGQQRFPCFDQEWKHTYLKNVCSIFKGEQLNKIELTKTGDYPALNGGVSPSGFTDKFNTEANTITISEGGNSCGFVNYITQQFWCGGHCYTLKNLTVNKAYLYQFLKSIEVDIMKLRVGSGLPNIQKKDIEIVNIKIPSSEEQQKIAIILTIADNEITIHQNQLTALKKQKKALMQQLLTGKVRVAV